MDAGKSAQELVHMTDEGSIQLPQPVALEVDETSQWMVEQQPFVAEKSEKLPLNGESDRNAQPFIQQMTSFVSGDAAKAAASITEQTEILQSNLVNMPIHAEYTLDAVEQAQMLPTEIQQTETLATVVPNAQPLMQTQTMLEMNMGGMQLQTEQQRMLMKQVQNSTTQQSRSVQVNNHLNPNISITFGDVRESADVDEVARRLRLCLLEEMQRCGEGVW